MKPKIHINTDFLKNRALRVLFLISVAVLFAMGFIATIKEQQSNQALKTPQQKINGDSKTTKYVPKPIPELFIPSSKEVEVSETTVNNFYEIAEVINANGDLSLDTLGEGYSIIYFPEGEQFIISILGSPFENIRPVAEKDFSEIMGVDKNALCKLNVVVTTPRFANPKEAGKNYKLSFCE